MQKLFRQLLFVLVALALIASQGTWALAGTTGGLNGVVTDGQSGSPIANAKVIVTSVSQTASTTTDGGGHFTFVSLIPDAYTVSAEKTGYDPTSIAGISVFSDQNQNITVSMNKSLKEIAKVVSRSAGDLIKSGTTADIYSVNAAAQKAAANLGGGGGLNNAYSAVASVPGVFVPAGQKGEYQSIFVRGGNYTQVGYEFDGVPIQRAFDQYPGASLSNLGQQELQVYTGSAPVNADSTALAGFINQVIKVGTYPGFGSISAGTGTPGFYHQLAVEAGGAAPNRMFSYYVGFDGYNQNFIYEKGNSLSSVWGPPINQLAANCTSANPTGGCYGNTAGLSPNGFEHGPIFFGSSTDISSRDVVANLHFGIPHKGDSGRDDIQLLWTNDYVHASFADAINDMGALQSDFLNGTITQGSTVIPSCYTAPKGAPCSWFVGPAGVVGFAAMDRWYDKVSYTGPLGTALTSANLNNVQFLEFPGSPGHAFSSAATPQQIPVLERDQDHRNGSIVKLQYQHNMGSNAYLRGYAYTTYSDWLEYGPNTQALGGTNFGGLSPDYKLGSHTRGGALQFTDQLNAAHLLNVNLSYTTASTFRYNNSSISESSSASSPATNSVAFLVDATNPTSGICYRAISATVTQAVDCGSSYAARYIDPQYTGQAAGCTLGTLCVAHLNPPKKAKTGPFSVTYQDPTLASLGNYSCGGNACEYFSTANGNNASYNTVVPKFAAFSVQDQWKPNDKWLFTLGLRYDDFKYVLANTTGDVARQFWVNYYNTWYCYNSNTQAVASASSLGITTPNNCASAGNGYQQLAFTSKSATVNDYPEWQPRFGFTFTQNQQNVFRFSAGKTAQPASSAFQQYNTVAPNLFAGTNQLFYSLGFTSPRHIVNPEESYNYDFSWEHQLKGTDMSFKLTPYVRTTKNELSTVLLDPVTNFVSSVNVGQKNVKGLEFLFRKGDLNRNGWFGQFSYTYTYAREKFTPLPSGKSVVEGLNQGIANYNAFTSFCANNSGDARCHYSNGAAPLDPNTGAPIVGAPCYTAAGAPDSKCLNGSIANPYWNAPVQALFDPNGQYAVYGTLAGSRFVTGSNQSYIVPHVASLILNYKHDRLNITPSFQLEAGGQYGRPTQVVGVDPVTCGALASGTTANDPRYPNGAAGGAPYDASTCGAGIIAPDPYTGHFDNYGQFREPNVLYGNLSASYDVSKKVTARLDLVNIIAKCFGGSNVPWKIGGNAGCNYGPGGTFVNNFYNPGDYIDPYVKYPYNPNFGSVFQSSSGGQANPFQAYFSVNIKL